MDTIFSTTCSLRSGVFMRGLNNARAVDHLLGAPVLWALGLVRSRSRAVPQRVERLGLLQTAAIGDTLLMGRAVAMLRRRFPDARITLFSGPSNLEAGRLLTHVDDLQRVDALDVPGSIRTLRRARLDVLVDFGPWPRINAFLAAMSGARFVVGFRTPGQHRHYCQDRSVLHRTDVHEEENQAALAAALDAPPTERPELRLPSPTVHPAGVPERYVVVHPWPGGSAAGLKRWTTEGWRAVGEWARARGLGVVITGGPLDAPESRTLGDALRTDIPGLEVRCLAGEGGLAETAEVLRRAVAVVSVDTGTMHLAGLLGCPTVALHGPTDPGRWGALGPKVEAVRAPGADCGYLQLGFDVPGNPPSCMERLTAASVVAALDRLAGR